MSELPRFDELAHAGPEHLDPAYVAGYDRKRGVDPVDDVEVLRRWGLNEAETLVDLGAGTGRLALRAAPHCRRVVAVDVSPPMLDRLRGEADRLGVSNVDCVEAGFLTYEPEGPPVGFVYSGNALHHLPDFWKVVALERIAGVVRPGGVLRLRDLVYDCSPAAVEETLARWFDTAVRDPAVGYTRDDLAEHVRAEYSTFRWLLEPMLDATGFDIAEVAFDRQAYGRYVCVRR